MEASSNPPAFLFDLDGTLVDSVYQHVLAWREALERSGIELAVWRIHRRIGMSGGLLVNALLRETGQFGIHRLVKNLKGVSSHTLRQEFRTLKSRLPTLWTNSYFVSPVGGAPLAVIKQYVENQKDV